MPNLIDVETHCQNAQHRRYRVPVSSGRTRLPKNLNGVHTNHFGICGLKRDRAPEPLDAIQGFRIPTRSCCEVQVSRLASWTSLELARPVRSLPEGSVTRTHESLPWVMLGLPLVGRDMISIIRSRVAL